MTVAAAVDITSPDQDSLIANAAKFAQQRGETCFMISIVGVVSEQEREVVERNLRLITSRNASPVMQEGSDVARCLCALGEKFSVGTMFIQNGRRRFGRTLAEQLIHLKPPFQVVVINRDP